MKLHEIAFVIGDDGGLHFHIDKAIKNMDRHGKKHSSKEVRDACVQAAARLRAHTQNPSAIHDDSHSLLKILSNFHGTPDVLRITHASDTLGSYIQSDND
jgi:hypothetical protein